MPTGEDWWVASKHYHYIIANTSVEDGLIMEQNVV